MEANPDIGSVIAAAERAARDGDYAAAEQHLQEAASLQEAQLGPTHPDLANTLNNLGVAREQAGRLDEAEESYRRAYAIAVEALPADHPFVVRSAENLRDFCAARGRPFDAPVPPQATSSEDLSEAASATPAEAASDIRTPDSAVPRTSAPASQTPGTPAPAAAEAAVPVDADEHAADIVWVESPAAGDSDAAQEPASRLSWLFWLVALVLIVAALLFWLAPWRSGPASATVPEGRSDAAESSPTTDLPIAPAVVPDAPTAVSNAGGAAPAPPAPDVAAAEVVPDPPTVPVPATSAVARAGGVEVASVDVCRNFQPSGEAWRCEPVADVTSPGALAYYTRIRSPRATTVVHQWFRDDALVQRVSLRVGANPGAGYRTYSRNTVSPANAGAWRVVLSDSDGNTLHEHRFVIR